MTEFRAFLEALGLRPGVIVADGKIRRCPTDAHPGKKNGGYCLKKDGRMGWGRDWESMSASAVWHADAEKAPAIPRISAAEIRAQQEEARAKQRAATLAAQAFYDDCRPLRGGHAYLEAHGLDMRGCFGFRVDASDWLVVPMYSQSGSLLSVQRISPDGEKRFWTGAPTAGARYAIARAPLAPLTVLCEGVATGLALFAAAPANIVVAFNAGNMLRVAQSFGFAGMVAVAADNDHRTVCRAHKAEGAEKPFEPWAERPEWCSCNPGRCAAAEAAAWLGCGIALPTGMSGTDWCDWRAERISALLATQARSPGRQAPNAAHRMADAEIAREMAKAGRLFSRRRESPT